MDFEDSGLETAFSNQPTCSIAPTRSQIYRHDYRHGGQELPRRIGRISPKEPGITQRKSVDIICVSLYLNFSTLRNPQYRLQFLLSFAVSF